MSFSKRAALYVLTATTLCSGASTANAASSFTATVVASGTGFTRPDYYNDFDKQTPINVAYFQIAFTPTDDPNYFISIVDQFTYEARFNNTGLTIATITSNSVPYPVVYASTCRPVFDNPTFPTGCGPFNLSVSFGGPAITSFTGSIVSVRLQDGDTLGGRGVVYSGFSSVVPEPSTWALMLAGFGMVGYAMRRRKLAFA